MKTLHSEDYYRTSWDSMTEQYGRKWNLEQDLELFIPDFTMLPEEQRVVAIQVAKRIKAKEIIATTKSELLKTKKVIEDIRAGKAGLGYTSKRQEVQDWHRLQEEFEFACLVLKDFRNKYEGEGA